MKSVKPIALLGIVYATLAIVSVGPSLATPQFARQTQLPCASCHTHVPRLNEFGQKFYANGFRLPGQKVHKTLPFWVQLAADGSSQDGQKAIPITYDETTIGSEGPIGSLSTILHAMYTPVQNEWEIHLLQPVGKHVSVQVGSISPLSQYDPGLDLTLSSPITLAPPDSFGDTAIGPFGPGNSVTGAQIVLSEGNAMPFGEGWKLAATVPMSNGADEAPRADFGWRTRGVFLELYRRIGVNTYGGNAFFGRDGRHYYGILAQQRLNGQTYLQASAAATSWFGHTETVYSTSYDWVPSFNYAYGLRIDQSPGQTAFVPFASWLLGGQGSLFKLQAESSLSSGNKPATAVEVSFRF